MNNNPPSMTIGYSTECVNEVPFDKPAPLASSDKYRQNPLVFGFQIGEVSLVGIGTQAAIDQHRLAWRRSHRRRPSPSSGSHRLHALAYRAFRVGQVYHRRGSGKG